jgi:hypothetical protein
MTKTMLTGLLLTAALAVPARAQDVQYELINDSSYTLMEFYTSAESDPNWGPDILGANVLPAGSSGTVTIADGGTECVYDIMMVFDSGETLEDSVDICQLASYTISDQ